MATPVWRCDPCGCGAELAVLLNRFEALTASVTDLVIEVRGWRADQARRRAASEQDDRDAILGVLIAELVGDDVFTARDLMVRGVEHVGLQRAMVSAGASNARRLGHLLVRLEARRGDGLHFLRIGADRSGTLWRVLRD